MIRKSASATGVADGKSACWPRLAATCSQQQANVPKSALLRQVVRTRTSESMALDEYAHIEVMTAHTSL